MFGITNMVKMAISGAVAAATVVLTTQVRGGDSIRNQAAQLLRAGARGARWVADKADYAADLLEDQDSEEYVNAQWAKIDRAQERVAH